MIIERDIFEDNGEKASCGYDGAAINQRWCAKNVRLGVIPGRRRYKKTIAGALPCVGPNPSYTAPTVGCGLCVLCDFARDMGAHIVLRASSRRRDHTARGPLPGLRYACPRLEKGHLFEAIAAHSRVWPLRRAVVFGNCQQPCRQLPAWLSANVDNLANKCQQPEIEVCEAFDVVFPTSFGFRIMYQRSCSKPKTPFFSSKYEKSGANIWLYGKNYVPLQSQLRNGASAMRSKVFLHIAEWSSW